MSFEIKADAKKTSFEFDMGLGTYQFHKVSVP